MKSNLSVPEQSEESAAMAGLKYVSDGAPGIRRVGRGKKFSYVGPGGKTVRDPKILNRIKALVIPPAWTDVWICADPAGHLQATGRDARGRKQYRYHSKWRAVRDETKYDRILDFAKALPLIRRKVAADLRKPGLPIEKVVATVLRLLEETLIRVGNEEYARSNHSYGLTTMRDRHVRVNRESIKFIFQGKGGKSHEIVLHDSRVARIVRRCRDLPGQELFQYVDENEQRRSIGSVDVNAYLNEITGRDFTAKDFRTWAGTCFAAAALWGRPGYKSAAEAKRNIVEAIGEVSRCLGNTPAICRKCYVHPVVLDSYLAGKFTNQRPQGSRKSGFMARLKRHEAAVARLIRQFQK